MITSDNNGLLAPYRALDLADRTGLLMGKLMADMGADVIKIEPPGGDPGRKAAPVRQGQPAVENDSDYLALDAGKRAITLDPSAPAGRAVLEKLVRSADFVLDSGVPCRLSQIGVTYETLRSWNPGVILVLLSPYGADGPYAGLKATDLVLMAQGGVMYVTGDPDRQPIRVSSEQAFFQGAAHGVVGALIALLGRNVTGAGQRVDVSALEAVVRCLQTELPYWEFARTVLRRHGVGRQRAATISREVWRCKDGYVAWRMFGGRQGARHVRGLVSWMAEEGMAGELPDHVGTWEQKDLGRMGQAEIDLLEAIFARFFLAHTKASLAEHAARTHLPLSPINEIGDTLHDAQLTSRGFWLGVRDERLGMTLTHPGHLWLSNLTYSGTRGPAPSVGEHNMEVFQELGISPAGLQSLLDERVV